jgi:hypothetical protein
MVEGNVQLKKYTTPAGVVIKVVFFGNSEKKVYDSDERTKEQEDLYYDTNEYDQFERVDFKENVIFRRRVVLSINDSKFAMTCKVTPVGGPSFVFYVDFYIWGNEVYKLKGRALSKAVESEINANRHIICHGGMSAAEEEYLKRCVNPNVNHRGFPDKYKYLLKCTRVVHEMQRFGYR